MPYTTPSFAAAKAALASRLNDPGKVHWVDEELGRYIREALRTWNAWCAHWRDQCSFPTVMSQPFYDLPTEIPSLRAYTITNWEMIRDLQYALMEPPAPGGTWTGTDQFTLAQLTDALQGRRDQFLQETGAVLTRTLTDYPSPPAWGLLDLAETVLDVRRAAWRPNDTQLLLPLIRADEWASTHYQPRWGSSTQPPTAYSLSVTPPLTLQLMPPAGGAGTLDLVAIQSGGAIDPAVESLLGIPDDFAWVVKYGALAELLAGDGLATDPGRAAYCEQRWEQGIAAARSAAVVLNVEIDDFPTMQAGLSDMDLFSPLWQLVPGTPNQVMTAGQNLLIVCPPPGSPPLNNPMWLVTCDVVRNAPVPTLDDDVLQVSQDLYDTLLDLAQHIATFKQGPGEVDVAMGLLEQAASAAGIDLKRQQATFPDRTASFGQQQQDRRTVPEQRGAIPILVEGS